MWSIGSGSKSGGGNGDRNLLLQEAKRERERREREREQRAYGFRLKNFLQLVSFRRREARRFRTDLTKKLNDLDAVANMLAKKGMKSSASSYSSRNTTQCAHLGCSSYSRDILRSELFRCCSYY
jgi:hypothetical protein